MIIGFLLADLLTGMAHWFEDSYLGYCNDLPILGTIAKDNELHHYFPRSILAYSYLEHLTFAMPMTLTAVGLLFVLNRSAFRKYFVCILTFTFFSSIANIMHRFTHMRDCETNSVFKHMQKIGVFCSHDHHSIHHTSFSSEKYCVISEYNNYILDHFKFWSFLEYLIYIVTNIKPNRPLPYESYHEIHNHMHENAKLSCPDKPTRSDVETLIIKLKKYKDSLAHKSTKGCVTTIHHAFEIY